MKHLTVDEIVDFVSFNSLDADSLGNAAKVNSHIKNCEECLRKVRAFQVVYDELCKMGKKSAFRNVAEKINEGKLSREDLKDSDNGSPDING